MTRAVQIGVSIVVVIIGMIMIAQGLKQMGVPVPW